MGTQNINYSRTSWKLPSSMEVGNFHRPWKLETSIAMDIFTIYRKTCHHRFYCVIPPEKKPRVNMSRPVVSCPVVSCRVLSCPVVSCRVLSCPVVSCPVLSCPVLSCPVLSCPVLSCEIVYQINHELNNICLYRE